MSKPAESVDPRIAPKEIIVTRFKSSMQKRTLRDKDRNMKNITKLLKSPPKPKNVKKKSPKSSHNSEEVINKRTNSTDIMELNEANNTEYYPQKLRRKFEEKKVFLKPKYEPKTVVKMNKRKLGTPQKGVALEETNDSYEQLRSKSPMLSELSMEEIVRNVEETDSLDDEDLMEILTCPSPVWWEDPPDESYIEDSICEREELPICDSPTNDDTEENVNSTPNGKIRNSTNISDGINMNAKDNKFINKRNKLEGVLGNIKNRNSDVTVNEAANRKLSKNNKVNENKTKPKTLINVKKFAHQTISSNVLSDLADNLIKDLECIHIPIENEHRVYNTKKVNTSEEKSINLDESNDMNEECEKRFKVISADSNSMETRSENNNTEVLVDIEKNEKPLDNLIKEKPLANNIKQTTKYNNKIEIELSKVPINLPPLIKRPKIFKMEKSESSSIKSVSDDGSSMSGLENIDSISDTNIKFISDEEVDSQLNKLKEKSFENIKQEIKTKINTEFKADKSTKDELLKAISEKKDFITVYKIVSNEIEANSISKFKNLPEYSSHVENLMRQEHSIDDQSKHDGQLNSFFKKCKNINRKRKRDLDNKQNCDIDDDAKLCDGCVPKKCITVAQEENVKYCLNCSSIFDTDDCSYCNNTKSVECSEIASLVDKMI